MSFPVANRIFPLPARIFPLLRGTDAFPWIAGDVKRTLLNERGYPFNDLQIGPEFVVTLAEHKSPSAGGFTTIVAGDYPDIITAARFVSYTPTQFAFGAVWTLRLTESEGLVRTREVTVNTDVLIATKYAKSKTQRKVRPFATASFAASATGIVGVGYSVAGAATIAKTAIPRVELVSSTHDGSNNVAILTDSAADFVAAGVRVGDTVSNDTDGSEATITAVTATTIAGVLAGGTDDDWDAADGYTVYVVDDYVRRAKLFEYTPTDVGRHAITLYVDDGRSPTVEFTDTMYLEVI